MSALPREYSEANILNQKVTKPCQVNGNGELCNQFSYPSLESPEFVVVEMETGYIYVQRKRQDTQVFDDPVVQKQLDFNAMALLDSNQVTTSLYSRPNICALVTVTVTVTVRYSGVRFALLCFALLCFALRCVALRCVALLCFALRCVALLCFALLCFALLCVALLSVLCSALAWLGLAWF